MGKDTAISMDAVPERHWAALQSVERAVALAMRFFHVDVSGLFYRPWQFYNSMMLAEEYNAEHQLLFGSDWPIATPEETAQGIRNVNHVVDGTTRPKVALSTVEEILARDPLKTLGIS